MNGTIPPLPTSPLVMLGLSAWTPTLVKKTVRDEVLSLRQYHDLQKCRVSAVQLQAVLASALREWSTSRSGRLASR